MIYQINVQRVRYGRSTVAASTCPDWYAEGWGGLLARTGSFYHRSMTAILNGCHAARAAENLARGNFSADGTVAAWMASPGHRANILDGGLTGSVWLRSMPAGNGPSSRTSPAPDWRTPLPGHFGHFFSWGQRSVSVCSGTGKGLVMISPDWS